MRIRHDALVAAADIIRGVREVPRKIGGDMVSTVGRLDVAPNIPNAIPGRVSMSIDLRAPDEHHITRGLGLVDRIVKEAAKAEGVTYQLEHYWRVPRTRFALEVVDAIEAAVQSLGCGPRPHPVRRGPRRAVHGRHLPHRDDLRPVARRTQPLRGGVHPDGRYRARREHATPPRLDSRGRSVARAPGMSTPSSDAHPIIAAVRRFVEKEVAPAAPALEHADAYPHELVARMRELGLFGALVPKGYGGLGLDVGTYARVIEEICRGFMSLAGVINSHTMAALIVLTNGTDEQRRRLLPRFARGEARGGLCLTEPHAGSDVQAIRTVARRDGDRYLISGSKMFVTNGREGNTFALLAVTDPPPRRATPACPASSSRRGSRASRW
jgi:Acyl-CoA dehydrogenases